MAKWKLIRQTVDTAFETPEIEAIEGRKIFMCRVRGAGNGVSIVCNSAVVSRNHCELEFRNGDWFVADWGSMNGTYVNGEKIKASTPKMNVYEWTKLSNGDIVGLGIDEVPGEDQIDASDDRNQTDFFVFKFIKLGSVQAKSEVELIETVTISDSEEEIESIKSDDDDDICDANIIEIPVKKPIATSSSSVETPAKKPIATSSSSVETPAKKPIATSSSSSETPAKKPIATSSSSSEKPVKKPIATSSSSSEKPVKKPIATSSSSVETPAKKPIATSSSSVKHSPKTNNHSDSKAKCSPKQNKAGPASWKKKQSSDENESKKSKVSSPEASSVKRKHEVSVAVLDPEKKRCRLQEQTSSSNKHPKRKTKSVSPEPRSEKGSGKKSNESNKKAKKEKSYKKVIIYSSDEESSTEDQSRSSSERSLSVDERRNPQLDAQVSILLRRSAFIDETGSVGWDEIEMSKSELSMDNVFRIERQLLCLKYGPDYLKSMESPPKKTPAIVTVGEISPPSTPSSPENDMQEEENGFMEPDLFESNVQSDSESDEQEEHMEQEFIIDTSLKDKQGPKYTKPIIIDPPPDPSRRRKQRSPFVSPPSPKFKQPQMSPRSMKDQRNQRLKKLATIKNKERKEKASHNPGPPVVLIPQVKVKNTKKSRADSLFDDLNKVAVPSSRINAAHTAQIQLIQGASSLRNQMPINRIVNNRPVDYSDARVIQNRQYRPQPSHQPGQELLQKKSGPPPQRQPAVAVKQPQAGPSRPYRPEQNGTYNITNRLMDSSSSKSAETKSIAMDEPYKDILVWNPKWLEEQKDCKSPPPELLGNRKLIGTVSLFVKFSDYVEIFYPLLMMEFWRSLMQDYGGGGKSYKKQFAGKARKTFFIGIEDVKVENKCPLLYGEPSQESRNQRLPNNEIDSDFEWSIITCHGFSHDNLLDRHYDFGIVILHFNMPDDAGQPKLMNRKLFTFIKNGDSIPIDPKTSVHKELYRKEVGELKMRGEDKPKYKTTFYLILKMTPQERNVLASDKPMELQKIYYVAPTLRDFKSVLTLHESPLCRKILEPSLDYPTFNPATPTSNAVLPSSLSKLNPAQKLIVHSVSDRVLRDTNPEIMLLHGPPGTGKTNVIVALIVQLLKGPRNLGSKTKILVCTPSNTALNEIISRLNSFWNEHYKGPQEEKPLMVRIGNEESKILSLDKLAEKRCKPPSADDSIVKAIKDAQAHINRLHNEISEKQKMKEDVEQLCLDLQEEKRRLDKHKKDLENLMSSCVAQLPRGQLEKEKGKILQEVNILFSTLGSCTHPVLQRHLSRTKDHQSQRPKLTVCIIDEATQATEPESVAPLMLDVTKLLLVGDPFQLPATVISEEASANNLGESLFTRHFEYYKKKLLGKQTPTMFLELQYRMHPEILSWPNRYFYYGKLKTPSIVTLNRQNKLRLMPYVFINFDGEESNPSADGKISNADEIKLLFDILKIISLQRKTMNEESTPLTIGVITPYREQKNEIKDALEKFKKQRRDFEILSAVQVDTIDSYQGREIDILILSCVRSQAVGFLNSKKRLCVALTRARQSLIIIGKMECLSRNKMWCDLIEDAKKRQVLKHVPNEYSKAPNGNRVFIERAILLDKEKSVIAEDSRLDNVRTAAFRSLQN